MLGHQSIVSTKTKVVLHIGLVKTGWMNGVANAVYFYTLTVGEFTTTHKMLIVK